MTDTREDPRVIAVFWAMRGETEWPHDSVQKEVREDSAGLYEIRRCIKCDAEWIWHTKYGECDYPTKECKFPDPIGMSIGDLAFWMRDHSDAKAYMREVHRICGMLGANLTDAQIYLLTPTMMIEAATLAFEAADAQQGGKDEGYV